jgi:hypothetical protein
LKAVEEKALKANEKVVAALEKKHQKALEDLEKKLGKSAAGATKQVDSLQKEVSNLQTTLQTLTDERDKYKLDSDKLEAQTAELLELRKVAERVGDLETSLKKEQGESKRLEELYQKEQSLRKKYWNEIEDMKGKIRVYARCRPFAKYEVEKGCEGVVGFPNEMTVELNTNRGVKSFNFDCVFAPGSTQDQVFQDTERLIQSAMDGYNVCIFAYGQVRCVKLLYAGCIDVYLNYAYNINIFLSSSLSSSYRCLLELECLQHQHFFSRLSHHAMYLLDWIW